ncbi:hypothetical protein L3Q72_16385 [Vibrio sp. JC009]|uniref:hypothetical protein n=1 Tax=Vibrio sp. JC009 TaxID=2912314 RepID=UPI0023B159B1|nr:hypothetical protein [Vibrio sp. JC009]WED24454.1 hypothetical protein L3Q72_16385 [Vibrio sp. JC009]
MSGIVRKFAIIAAAVFSSFSANANNFSYNNLDIMIGTSPTSVGVGFSSLFVDNAHFLVRGDSRFEGDWILTGGIGFNGPVNQFADIYGQMLLHNVKENDDDLVGNDFLPEFAVGTRVWMLQNIELFGQVGQLVDDSETHSTYNVGFRFHSTQQLVMGASLRRNYVFEGGNQLMMNVRFQY